MKLLAVESSGLVASAAVLDGNIIKAEYTVNTKMTHSQTLLPMIDEVVKMSGTDLSTLDAIAVSAGPGSFTGLRIGAATAKGLCLALNKPLIAVPTLDALINNIGNTEKLVVPIMDARRNQVYTKLGRDGKADARDVAELIADINKLGKAVIFLGDGVPVYRDKIEELIQVPHEYAPAHMALQRAASVAELAAKLKPTNADDFAPEYLRKSQAEREREEKCR